MNKRLFHTLLIGRDYGLAWALPQLLTRAGFCVDAISSSQVMRKCKFIRNCHIVPSHQSLIPAITKKMRDHYDWIIITEDGVLIEVLQSDLSLTDKLKLLPVQKEKNFTHLYSKIGLSKIFSSEGICTPPFSVAQNLAETLSSAEQLGYPILLKRDSSGGGHGIVECNTPFDLHSLHPEIFHRPVLLQKKIPGIELDVSAIYLEGNLIHFNYAKVEKQCQKFGISSVRTYQPLSTVGEQLFQELTHIGKVLGAHGFTNIGCIQFEGRRFYFETDMRPTVWVEFPRFFGEDPAIRIEKWFSNKETLSYPVLASPNQPSQILLPYFLRLKRLELLLNRYDVWKFIPRDDPKLIIKLLRIFIFSFGIRSYSISIIKRIVPKKYHKKFRKLTSILLEI